MKYIMLQTSCGSIVQRMPVIFPNELVHSVVAEAMIDVLKKHQRTDVKVVSAGECTLYDATCQGKSETLKLVSDEDDTYIVNACDYGAGFV